MGGYHSSVSAFTNLFEFERNMFQSTFVMGPICSHCYAVGWEVNDFHFEQDLAIKFNL